MADAVQKGIEAAQQDLVKDAEEKLLEEVNVIFDVIGRGEGGNLEQRLSV